MTRQTNFDPRWARHGNAYVVVADGARARILRRGGRRFAPTLLELERLERAGAQSDYDPHAVEVERFARRVAARLALLTRTDGVGELVLIAEPRFLGLLRRALSEPVRQSVAREVARDLTAALPQPIARAAFSLPAASAPAAAR